MFVYFLLSCGLDLGYPRLAWNLRIVQQTFRSLLRIVTRLILMYRFSDPDWGQVWGDNLTSSRRLTSQFPLIPR